MDGDSSTASYSIGVGGLLLSSSLGVVAVGDGLDFMEVLILTGRAALMSSISWTDVWLALALPSRHTAAVGFEICDPWPLSTSMKEPSLCRDIFFNQGDTIELARDGKPLKGVMEYR